MLSPATAHVIRAEIDQSRRVVARLDEAIQTHLDDATNLDRSRVAAIERIEALQADLAAHVPSPATLAAKAAR